MSDNKDRQGVALSDAARKILRAVDDVEQGRSIHNDRKPEDKIEGPVWRELRSASDAMRDILARASSSRAEVEIPEGYALVPKEPTDTMLDATRGRMSPGSWNNWGKKRHATIYRRMLAAAESPNKD